MDTPIKTTPTPGYRTTEFWLTLIINILAAVLAYLETIDASWALVTATIINSVYTLARMGIKAAAEKAKPIVPLLLMCFLAAAFLPSCKALEDSTINGEIVYRDPDTGAKGGIKITDGKTSGFIRVPVRDPDTGEIIAWANLNAIGKALDIPIADVPEIDPVK